MPTPPWPGGVAMAAMVSAWYWRLIEGSCGSNLVRTAGGRTGLGARTAKRPEIGAFAWMPAGRSVFCRGASDLPGNVPLLRDRQDVVDHPVQHQTGREPQEEEGEDDRQHLHYLGLHRVRRSRVELLLDEHAHAHQDRQDEVGILQRQVGNPANPRGLAHLDAFHQGPVQGDEHRHLYQDRQAATQWIDLFLLVQLHHALGHLLAVVAKLLAQRLQLGRYPTHVGHGAVAGGRKREKYQLDEDGQQDDAPAPVADHTVNQTQHPEQRLGDKPQETVVDSQFQARGYFLQAILILRTGIEIGTDGGLLTGRQVHRRADKTDDVVALAVLAGLIDMLLFSIRNPGADKIVLQPGDPATFDGFLQAAVIHLAEFEFLVGVRRTPVGGT